MADVRNAKVLSGAESARVLERERAEEEARPKPSWWTRRRVVLAGILLVVLLVVGRWTYQQFFASPPQVPLPSTGVSTVLDAGSWPAGGGGPANTRRTLAPAALGGAVGWTRDLELPVLELPVADEQRLYVSLADNLLVALDVADGAERWRYRAAVPLGGAPALAAERLYLTTRRGDVIAFDAASGEQQWEVGIGAQLFSSPVVVDGVLYVYGTGTIAALDAATGERLWTGRTGESWGFILPVVREGHIAVAGRRTVYIFDLATGLKTFAYPHFRVTALLSEAGRVISISPNFANAVDPDSQLPWWDGMRVVWGQLWLWGFLPEPPRPDVEWVTRDPPSDAHPNVAQAEMFLSATDGAVLVAANQNGLVRAYRSRDGTLAWELRLPDVTASPVFTAFGLLLSTSEGLTLRDPADGAELATHALPDPFRRELVVTDHGTYVVHDSGRVVALR